MFRRRLRKFFSLPWGDRLLLTEATLWLGLARLMMLAIPFRWFAPSLGQRMLESPTTDAPDRHRDVHRVSRAVVTMSRYTPWQSQCLTQAIAGKMMLKRRGIASTLYLGVAKERDNRLSAHAWLRSGTVILTGGPGRERFTVVSTFADRQK